MLLAPVAAFAAKATYQIILACGIEICIPADVPPEKVAEMAAALQEACGGGVIVTPEK